jgi:hypothetical protein
MGVQVNATAPPTGRGTLRGPEGPPGERGPKGAKGDPGDPTELVAGLSPGEALSVDEDGAPTGLSVVSRDEVGVSPAQFGGVGDGVTDDTAAVQAAADAAEGGRLILPIGTTWLVDPIALKSHTTVQVDGTIKLIGQDAANLPAAFGVLYGYGSAEDHLENITITGFGTIDGNRRGMTNTEALGYDQEGINFKYVDGWRVENVTITDAIDSGLDIDHSTAGIAVGVRSHDNAGYGFHMSNGAVDNALIGCVATGNGVAQDRGGFDQYDWTSPQANRNRYIGCYAAGNNRNYRIGGVQAVMEGCISIDGAKPDEITANLSGSQPAPPLRRPVTPLATSIPATGATVDPEARAAVTEMRAALQSLGLVRSAPAAPTAWASDDFARTTTGTLGTASSGQAWTSAGFECNGTAAARTNEGYGVAHWSGIGTANVRLVTEITTGAERTSAGVRGRASGAHADAGYLVVDLADVSGTNGVRLRKKAGNGPNTDIVVNTDVEIEPSTTYELDVSFVGDTVLVRLDGVPVIWHVLSAADFAEFGGRGYFGPYSSRTATQDDGTTRWESFALYRLDA